MISKTITCDRCGKEIQNPHSCYVPTYAVKDYSAKIEYYGIGVTRTNPQRIDLCQKCNEKFIDFIESEAKE